MRTQSEWTVSKLTELRPHAASVALQRAVWTVDFGPSTTASPRPHFGVVATAPRPPPASSNRSSMRCRHGSALHILLADNQIK